MGNLEKLLVVGVLAVVIAILAVSLFWSGDISTFPEVPQNTMERDVFSEPVISADEIFFPEEPLSMVDTVDIQAPVQEQEAPVGITPTLPLTSPPEENLSPGEETFRTYVIKRGDTLEKIAQKELGSKSFVSELFKANEGIDPRRLRIGGTILIPTDVAFSEARQLQLEKDPWPSYGEVRAAEAIYQKEIHYTVRKGDTLTGISKKLYGNVSKWRRIYEANKGKLSDPDALRIGMKLIIP